MNRPRPQFALTPCRFDHWGRADAWELQQAAFVLCGFEPPDLAELVPASPNPYGIGPSTPLNWADLLGVTSRKGKNCTLSAKCQIEV